MTAIPHDLNAEAACIAAIVSRPDAIPELAAIVDAPDFYRPAHASLWAIAVDAWNDGQHPDVNYLAARTDDTKVITDALAHPVTTAAARTNALRVANLAVTRRIQATITGASSIIEENPNADPADLLDVLGADLARIDLPQDSREIEGLWHAADMVAESFPVPPDIIPGLLRAQDRLMVVGIEGGGKTTWMRWIASQASQGRQPFTGAPIDPIRALIIDTENSPADIRDGLTMLRVNREQHLHVLTRPGGLDIRRRVDRSLVHRTCEQTQPDLICIGPLYKIGRPQPRESDEDTAVGIQNELDALRVRFNAALILEHHAPKGVGKSRDLVPFGSSAWYRWPEMGWKLIPYDRRQGKDHIDGLSLRVGTFRRDRHPIERPIRFDRSNPGPWVATWPTGTLTSPDEPEPDEPPF